MSFHNLIIIRLYQKQYQKAKDKKCQIQPISRLRIAPRSSSRSMYHLFSISQNGLGLSTVLMLIWAMCLLVRIKWSPNRKTWTPLSAFSNQFDIVLRFASPGSDSMTFRVNQRDAMNTNDGSARRWLHTEGSYRVSQHIDDERTLCLTVSNTSWMSDIPNGTALTNFTIPGTHDSCTKNGC